MNNAATQSASEIANLAHAAAERVLSGFAAAGMTMTDPVSCAYAAAVGIPAAHIELFVERFAGHVVNVQCGTAGR